MIDAILIGGNLLGIAGMAWLLRTLREVRSQLDDCDARLLALEMLDDGH